MSLFGDCMQTGGSEFLCERSKIIWDTYLKDIFNSALFAIGFIYDLAMYVLQTNRVYMAILSML